MADHLPLPRPTGATPKRRRGIDPDGPPLRQSRAQHATTLAGHLAGLGLPYPGETPTTPPGQEEVEEPDARIVLVFTGLTSLLPGPFRSWKMTPLAETGDKGVVVLTAEESRRTFAQLVQLYGGNEDDWHEPKAWMTQLDAIEGIRLYDRRDRQDPRLAQRDSATFPLIIDVMLWPTTLERANSRSRAANLRLQEIRDLVAAAAERDRSNRLVTSDPRPDTPVLRVVADESLLEQLLEHPLVERIAPPDTAPVSYASLGQVPHPEPPVPAGAPIGVIDDLVQANPYLDEVVVETEQFPAGHTWRPPTSHGTQVAGVAAYGGLRPLVDGSRSLTTPHPVFAARILQSDPGDPRRATIAGLFHVELESALRWLHQRGVKIVTLSINDDVPATRTYRSEAAAVIDTLVRDLDMVVIVSAGNRTNLPGAHWRDDYPQYLNDADALIADPGTAALAITTGAIAWYSTPGDQSALSQTAIARERGPSPFTRVGPAPGTTSKGTLKPEFAAHGGNWSWDEQLGLKQLDPAMGVITLVNPESSAGRLLGVATGTSYAAPYVAHEAAEIATRYPNADANLLRCLLALSGDGAAEMSPAAAYGIPIASRILESGQHRVVLTYEGTILPNHTLVHPVPVPTDFTRGRYDQRITIALAFDPEVRRTRRAYQSATMEIELVRNMTLEDVVATFQQQPSATEVEEDPTLVRYGLPEGKQRPNLKPGATTIKSNTLIRRRTHCGWDPDDEGYYIVVRHDLQTWANPADGDPAPQRYAIAVELALSEEARIDLYARVREALRTRARLRGRH